MDDVEMEDEPLGDLPYSEFRSREVDRPRSSLPAAADAPVVGTFGEVAGDPDAPG
jgi:hypothetical protein